MGNINSGKRTYHVCEGFFKTWNSNRAYILGFTCADGNLYGRSLSWELTNKYRSNLELLNNFNNVMGSNYLIYRRDFSYRLRISNRTILKDINALGIVPNKKKILVFPRVKCNYLRHFLRGFLDGDGWIVNRVRGNESKEICVGFSNGSLNFMNVLIEKLRTNLSIDSFNLRCRKKMTKAGKVSKTYQLEFYAENANKILEFLYGGLSKNDLFLRRKYAKYLESKKFFEETKKTKMFGRKWIEIEDFYGKSMKRLLEESLVKDNIISKDIADKFGVSLSTIYRWLDKSNVRGFEKRGSVEWSKKILFSKEMVKNG
ncbi:hypothetical protein COU60_04570 [Candidatus Pacearchaeota archaeon CG10_big_fil_rev_8_21_14_0_10_34_76]|nr:MAG: hypothetical protein COU60_04570 [Candidatus Pacearchaeota archaeon CG10_big_fil_rev_8_21_14_0_10_34_76]